MLVGAAVGVPGIGVAGPVPALVQGEGGIGKGTDDELAERLPDHPVAHLLGHADRRPPSPLVRPSALLGLPPPPVASSGVSSSVTSAALTAAASRRLPADDRQEGGRRPQVVAGDGGRRRTAAAA